MMHVENFYIFRIIFHLSNILTLFFFLFFLDVDFLNGRYFLCIYLLAMQCMLSRLHKTNDRRHQRRKYDQSRLIKIKKDVKQSN